MLTSQIQHTSPRNKSTQRKTKKSPLFAKQYGTACLSMDLTY